MPLGLAPRAPAARLLAGRIAGLSRARRHLLAALLGACATAALPPVFAVPLLVPAFVGLVWLLDAAPRGGVAFWLGWSFGAGYFATGLYWISHALLTDPERFGWMIPFALFGLAGGLGLFTGAATWLAHCTGLRGVGRIFALAVAWSVLEWLRGHVLTGFPWNLVGTAWAVTGTTMQPAAWIGVYGLGLLTVLAAAMPAILADQASGRGRRWLPVVLAAAGLGALFAAAATRPPDGPAATVSGVQLRIVQPDISQDAKARRDRAAANLAAHVRLTRSPGFDGITHVVWPETAVPYAVAAVPAARAMLLPAIPEGGLLLTGAPRLSGPAEERRYWNSFHALDDSGAIVATYDKHHLVPFGEYVPFHLRELMDLSKVTPGSADFSAGPGPVTLALPGLPPVSPLICYEAIFADEVVGAERPGWLLNVTNDGWFGISSGPHQHFASARFRAVEQGLPLVRAANTGISAVVDAYGRVVGRLPLGQAGVLDAPLPAASPPTLYARAGDWILLVLLACGVLGAWLLGRRN